MEDIEAINEQFPDELLTDADFEAALDALCQNPDDDFKREITEMMSEHQMITWEEAEQILGDTGNEPVKCSLPQQTRPTEPDNEANIDETIWRLQQNDPGLINVNLNNLKRTPIPKIKRVIEAMKQSEFIQQLSLANMGLYDNDIAPLVDLLEDNDSLRKLNLETNYLSGEFFAKLFRAANKNQCIEEIKAVNQGMNFSTQAERDIIAAIKENHALTKISLNIRLPELRNKIQQITMRNQEIRRILRKRAAGEEKAAAEAKRKEEEERLEKERRRAELLKPKPQKAPLKVFPKELLPKKKEEPKQKPIEPEDDGFVRASISKIVSENPNLHKADSVDSPTLKQHASFDKPDTPKGVAPMILGEALPEPKEKKRLQRLKRFEQPEPEVPTNDVIAKKPVLKKLASVEQKPKALAEVSKLDAPEWPPRPKEKTAAPKAEIKKNPLLAKWEAAKPEEVKKVAVDNLLTKEEPSKAAKPEVKEEARPRRPWERAQTLASGSKEESKEEVRPSVAADSKLKPRVTLAEDAKPKEEEKPKTRRPWERANTLANGLGSSTKEEPKSSTENGLTAKPKKTPIDDAKPKELTKVEAEPPKPRRPWERPANGVSAADKEQLKLNGVDTKVKPKLDTKEPDSPAGLRPKALIDDKLSSKSVADTKAKTGITQKTVAKPKAEAEAPKTAEAAKSARKPWEKPLAVDTKPAAAPAKLSPRPNNLLSPASALSPAPGDSGSELTGRSVTSESEGQLGEDGKPKKRKRIVKRIVRRRKKKPSEASDATTPTTADPSLPSPKVVDTSTTIPKSPASAVPNGSEAVASKSKVAEPNIIPRPKLADTPKLKSRESPAPKPKPSEVSATNAKSPEPVEASKTTESPKSRRKLVDTPKQTPVDKPTTPPKNVEPKAASKSEELGEEEDLDELMAEIGDAKAFLAELDGRKPMVRDALDDEELKILGFEGLDLGKPVAKNGVSPTESATSNGVAKEKTPPPTAPRPARLPATGLSRFKSRF